MYKDLVDIFNNRYIWSNVGVNLTDNGYFMNIELSDDHYGTPEYRIYNNI